jgi:ATP-binding protein involved in chromosome partitioning
MADLKEVVSLLRQVNFPDIDRDIVSLGYLKDIREEDGGFVVRIELSTNLQGAGERIEQDCHRVLSAAGVQYRLEMDAHYLAEQPAEAAPHDPPHHPALALPEIPFKIAVASGKGGVGKSTVAVNLALAFAKLGYRTGLLDGDIYGPSVPMMLGSGDLQPEVVNHQMIPIERFGVQSLSIGNLIDPHTPMVWRGPMAGKAIEQLMTDVDWSGVEVLVFDLPPGTGDVQISLSQKVELTGAIIVTTPQDVALIDAGKGIGMFQKVSVPILGIVENMSYFACPHCGERTDIFRSGGGSRESDRFQVPFLGEIPIDPQVVLSGDEGSPIVARNPEAPAAQALLRLASRVAEAIGLAPAKNG